MPQGESLILVGVGGGFIIIGLAAIIWGRHEDKSYFNSLTARHDLREFMTHWPERPQPGALRMGGWIAIVVGLLLLAAGFVSWLGARAV
ncbi:hypothetical protein ACFLV0_07165 [Chloroflexota bacterium]